jgi:hypothetical protein
MTKTTSSNHFLGGSGGGLVGGGGVLGENWRVGTWWLPFTGISPITVVLIAFTGAAICGAVGVDTGAACGAEGLGANGLDGECADLCSRIGIGVTGLFEAGLSGGVAI